MSLISDIKSKDKKGLFASDDNFVNYSTGNLALDYANGFWQDVKLPDGTITQIPVLGIIGGTNVCIIGETGAGKTTFADDMAYNIIKPYPNGVMIHVDCEKTLIKQRVVRTTGVNWDDERVILNKEKTSIEDVLAQFNEICEMKESLGKACMYEVKNLSYDGKSFWVYEPTVFVIDALPSFNSSKMDDEGMGTNMDAAIACKHISRFYNNTIDRMIKYNITIIWINHIRPDVVADPYAAPPKGLMMLRKGETLPRGRTAQYLTQNFFRINMKRSDAYTKEDDGFTGFHADIQVAKSKTNMVGSIVPVTFNAAVGFEPIFSLYEFGKSLGLIQGRNPNLYFEGLDAFKFSRKNFVKKMKSEKQFFDGVMGVLTPYLESLLGSKELNEDEKVHLADIKWGEDSEGQD